jgi:chromate transport protein ChrA
LIGTYWIVLGLFVIRARLPEFMLGDMVLFGLVPFAVALVLRIFGPRATREQNTTHAWTHVVAVILVATWPIAWVALILLGTMAR